MSTLSKFAQLRAYWFNPDTTKVKVKIRDLRDYGTYYHREDILIRLAEAKAKLEGKTQTRSLVALGLLGQPEIFNGQANT